MQIQECQTPTQFESVLLNIKQVEREEEKLEFGHVRFTKTV